MKYLKLNTSLLTTLSVLTLALASIQTTKAVDSPAEATAEDSTLTTEANANADAVVTEVDEETAAVTAESDASKDDKEKCCDKNKDGMKASDKEGATKKEPTSSQPENN